MVRIRELSAERGCELIHWVRNQMTASRTDTIMDGEAEITCC